MLIRLNDAEVDIEESDPVPGCGGILNSLDIVQMIRENDASGFANLFSMGLSANQRIKVGNVATIPKFIMQAEILRPNENYSEVAKVFIEQDPSCFNQLHPSIFKLSTQSNENKLSDYLSMFLASGMSPDIITNTNYSGDSLLIHVARTGKHDLIAKVLQYNPNVGYRNNNHENALDVLVHTHYQSEIFDEDSLLALLDAGSNPFTKLTDGMSVYEFLNSKSSEFRHKDKILAIQSIIQRWETGALALERLNSSTPKRATMRLF